jgi:iron complex outermembrane receptor protein
MAAQSLAGAMAQSIDGGSVEQVVVTGTSIRGVVPAGTNLITVSPDDIKASGATTIQGMLANTPVISNFGSAGQGQIGIDYYQPSIHNLGASGSNATLVLIDGHLPPTGGTNHSTADPNIIPSNMLERVEVIANGDSSIYGANAVAGVINFITRKRYEGVQLNAQIDYLHGTKNLSAGILSGTSWAGGNVIFAYQYVNEGGLMASERSFSADQNQTARAIAAGLPVGTPGSSKTNFNSFTGAGPGCSQPLVRVNGTGNYYNMVTGQTYSTNAASAPCNLASEDMLLSHEIRNNVMMKLTQEFGANLTVNADLLYASRRNDNIDGVGTVSQVTTFATGPQANPFFRLPPGYAGAATKETVYANLDQLLGGRRVFTNDSAFDMFGDLNADYRIGDNFVIHALAVAGRTESPTLTKDGQVNASSVDLALNGTGNNGGSTTAPAVAGTTIVPLNLPLTTANALDIWNTGANNRTSQAVLNSLTDGHALKENISSFTQFRLSTDGTLMDLPGGPLKVALGGEVVKTTLQQQVIASNNTGPTSTGANYQLYNFQRIVASSFAEANIPIVSPDMGVPLMERLAISASGRYDDYNDVGITTNYKLAFDWDVFDGMKLRGNMSTSFVAPGLDQIGNKYHAFAGTTYGATTGMDGLAIPVAAFPALTQFAPSQFNNGQACTQASVTCVLASTVQGVNIHPGAVNGKPARGRGWEVGFDFAPTFLPGLQTSVTYWNSEYLGAFTAPNIAAIFNTPSLFGQATFYPGAGADPAAVQAAAIGLRQTSALPPVISAVIYTYVGNYLYLYAGGLDASINYTFDTDYGTFTVGDTLAQALKYDSGLTASGVPFSILNTTGTASAFPATATQMRASLGWSTGPYSANLFANYTGGYHNRSGTSVIPISRDAQGNPVGGGDPVKANLTFDAHLGYQFSGGMFGDDEVDLTVINIAGKNPPFYLTARGYDQYVGNPLGRIIKLGFTAKL